MKILKMLIVCMLLVRLIIRSCVVEQCYNFVLCCILDMDRYAENSGNLMESEEFQRLFLECPRVAMELAECFLKF